ncbi:MAG: Wzz/FepE/Etk N-terminal domain-containing protein [Afipia sp.]
MRIPSYRDFLNSAADPFRKIISPTTINDQEQLGSGYSRRAVLRDLWRTLLANRYALVFPTLAVFLLAVIAVNLIDPTYTSNTRLLLGIHAGADSNSVTDRSATDIDIQNQIQLLLSRDFAMEIIRSNKLDNMGEFDPVLSGVSPFKRLLAFIGIGSDPLQMVPQARVLEAWYDRLKVYVVGQSSVLAVEFNSRDPELAAKITRSIADGYVGMKQSAVQRPAVQIISQALTPGIQTSPRKFRIIVSATAGALFLIMICVLRLVLLRAIGLPRTTATISP